MKKFFIIALAACGMMAAQAQTKAYEIPSFWDNWSVGLDGGVTTPLAKHHTFFKDMRGTFGLHIQKQVSPVVAIGVEGVLGVNTSSWNTQKYFEDVFADYIMIGRSKTAFDNSYVGAYASFNLMNLFGGYKDRLFDIELVAGAGWGHNFYNDLAFMPLTRDAEDQNYFMTKAGLNFNFNVCKSWTISLKPSVGFDMTGTKYQPLVVDQTSAAYNRNKATFNCMAGVTYNFGPGFKEVDTKNQKEIDLLNGEIETLRNSINEENAKNSVLLAQRNATLAELEACKNQPPKKQYMENEDTRVARYVYFKFSSSVITPDQMPNVDAIGKYMQKNKDSKVLIEGYASKEGSVAFNDKLSQARAESVKKMLVKKYGIAADRITAEGKGVSDRFRENAWNRVSICILED